MIKYKTYEDLDFKTFKFNDGLNVLIPFNYDKSKSLLNEMNLYFSNEYNCKQLGDNYFLISSPDELIQLSQTLDNEPQDYKPIIVINGLDINFMFMSCAQKLDLRIKLTALINKFKNACVIFFTDDYSFISHTRSILVDNSRIVRTFKSYDAYYKFIMRGAVNEISS